jgi:anti-sigma factor ChrR (cupin superfamily)
MTTFSDETLMAYADGELDAATRAAVESALTTDPRVACRIEEHKALRSRLQAAYADELQEATPESLLAVLQGGDAKSPAIVSDIGDARRDAGSRAHVVHRRARWSRWQLPGAMAASLLVGVGVTILTLREPQSISAEHGAMVARGTLANALSDHLGGDRSTGTGVQIGLTFVSRSGSYCRLFTLKDASSSGVACRQAGAWHIEVLAQVADTQAKDSSADTYRTAASAIPPVILDAIQSQMVGEPLDGREEAAARERGWQRP